MPSWSSCGGGSTAQGMLLSLSHGGGGTTWGTSTSSLIVSLWQWYDQGMSPLLLWLALLWLHRLHSIVIVTSRHRQGGPRGMVVGTTRMLSLLLENDIVMSSLLFMLITYYSVMTDTYERD